MYDRYERSNEITTIAVAGFPEDASWREMKNLCRLCKGYERAHVTQSKSGAFQLFVKFSSAEWADRARAQLHGMRFDEDLGEDSVYLKADMARRDMEVREGKPARGNEDATPPWREAPPRRRRHDEEDGRHKRDDYVRKDDRERSPRHRHDRWDPRDGGYGRHHDAEWHREPPAPPPSSRRPVPPEPPRPPRDRDWDRRSSPQPRRGDGGRGYRERGAVEIGPGQPGDTLICKLDGEASGVLQECDGFLGLKENHSLRAMFVRFEDRASAKAALDYVMGLGYFAEPAKRSLEL